MEFLQLGDEFATVGVYSSNVRQVLIRSLPRESTRE